MKTQKKLISLTQEQATYWLSLLNAISDMDHMGEQALLNRIQAFLRRLAGQPSGWAEDTHLISLFNKFGYSGEIQLPNIKFAGRHYQYIAIEPKGSVATGLVAHISNNSTAEEYQRSFDSKEKRLAGGTHWEACIDGNNLRNDGKGDCGYLSVAQILVNDLPRVKAYLALTQHSVVPKRAPVSSVSSNASIQNTMITTPAISAPKSSTLQPRKATTSSLSVDHKKEKTLLKADAEKASIKAASDREIKYVQHHHQEWDAVGKKRRKNMQDTLENSSLSVEQLVKMYNHILENLVEVDVKGNKDLYMSQRALLLDKEYSHMGKHFFSRVLEKPNAIANEAVLFTARELLIETLAREAWRNVKANAYIEEQLRDPMLSSALRM